MEQARCSTLLKLALIASLILNVVFLYTLTQQETPAPVQEVAEEEKQTAPVEEVFESGQSYPLMRIVDGDTVIVGYNGTTEYVRLIGIDSPEQHDPGGAECYATEATSHLQELAQTGLVILNFDASQGNRDSYGRLLAYVELPDGTDLGESMLRDGYAREFTYAAGYERQAAYKSAEATAMQEQNGLWADDVCP
jgi:endonuclease YncB( thermonuclease family)